MTKKILHRFIILCFLASLSYTSAATSLYVFFPTEVRPKILQKKFTKLCPNIDTIVFGRINDYLKQLKIAPPEAIISLPPVIEKKPEYKTLFQGQRNGSINEKYVLVSINEAIKTSNLASIKIGVIDILGRKPMTSYVSKLLGSSVKIKRVTKTEDLLPLLTFNIVQAVFISESVYKKLKQTSKQNLISTNIKIKLDMISVATKTHNNTTNLNISQCINHLDNTTNEILGVDQWK